MAGWEDTVRPRAAIMCEGLDLARLKGLEIGALSHPLVRRADGPVTYVDQADTAALRATYARDPSIRVDEIVEVDAVWGDRTLQECLGGGAVDYIIASHVAEHVPDLITWLAEVRSVLKPGGALRLALPDCRFSHDALRAHTTLTNLLTARLLRARRPQLRDVLDFRLLSSSAIDGHGIYHGRARAEGAVPDVPFEAAVQSGQAVLDNPNTYFDVHCLVVHALGFAVLMEQLAHRGLLQLACVRMIETALPFLEFYAFLTPCDDADEVTASWRLAQATLHDPLPGSAAACPSDELRRSLEAEQAARRAAEAELARLQASLSWRVTAPLRHARAGLGKSLHP